MAEKLCKEQQISFGNSTKYSDFIDCKYIFLIHVNQCIQQDFEPKIPRYILKMSSNKSFDVRARFGAIYSTSKTKKYLLKYISR